MISNSAARCAHANSSSHRRSRSSRHCGSFSRSYTTRNCAGTSEGRSTCVPRQPCAVKASSERNRETDGGLGMSWRDPGAEAAGDGERATAGGRQRVGVRLADGAFQQFSDRSRDRFHLAERQTRGERSDDLTVPRVRVLIRKVNRVVRGKRTGAASGMRQDKTAAVFLGFLNRPHPGSLYPNEARLQNNESAQNRSLAFGIIQDRRTPAKTGAERNH